VNECFAQHPGMRFAYEQLSVATMKHKARAMNAYMRTSNLAHIPKQIAWNAAKRGVTATRVKSAVCATLLAEPTDQTSKRFAVRCVVTARMLM
jgi:hypothetical protein